MPDKVIPPMPTEDGTYTNRFITESTSDRGGIESAHIYQLNHGSWRVCLWQTDGVRQVILRGPQAIEEVERANRVLGGLVKLVPEAVDDEDRDCSLCKVPLGADPCTHVKGITTGRITMGEAAWRRQANELARLRTQAAEWEDAKTEVAVAEPSVEYEYGAKFFIDIGGGQGGGTAPTHNTERLKKRYTIPVGPYDTIAALKEDYQLPTDAVILRRRKRTNPDTNNYPWETA